MIGLLLSCFLLLPLPENAANPCLSFVCEFRIVLVWKSKMPASEKAFQLRKIIKPGMEISKVDKLLGGASKVMGEVWNSDWIYLDHGIVVCTFFGRIDHVSILLKDPYELGLPIIEK